MNELLTIYNVVRELGQFAPLVVIIMMAILWKNELHHIAVDVKWVKKELITHLRWHSERE